MRPQSSSASKISSACNSAVSAATAGRFERNSHFAYLPSEICMDAMQTGLYTCICKFKCFFTHTNPSKWVVVFPSAP